VRVVFDTNILISAAMKPGGLEAKAISMRELQPCISEEILAEYQEVLLREKFRPWRSQAEAILETVAGTAAKFTPTIRLTAAADDDDNRFLECAEAADAAYLITGNLRHYPSRWRQTKILNARMFFDLIGTTAQTDSHPDP